MISKIALVGAVFLVQGWVVSSMSLPSRQLSRVHGDTFALGKKFRVVAPTVQEATQNSEAVYALLKVIKRAYPLFVFSAHA